eukprot:CAMPEP_0174856214 /NCGR_PEP_ID=MMETSP1114-20130205/35349_1 /TAXON_ID=312471 /ORGANISM="Neobodo designis, Strain CCAP 1951/1" /LENGTH=205 /DNA_ID=CAMNT_0016090999 /DNA_START=41 /DNA_END=654 /DNA_ORIENTATION=-
MEPSDIESKVDAAVKENGAWFDVSFRSTKAVFDAAKERAWEACGEAPPATEHTPNELHTLIEALRDVSTVDSDNRVRDAERVSANLQLRHPERGDATAKLEVHGVVVADGFARVLYGDHGPYFELLSCCVHWIMFDDHVLKGPKRHYHEHRARIADLGGEDTSSRPTVTVVMLYNQFNGVGDEPNPPPGEWSCANNRAEGYAPYV